jgi:hypothetical protein
MDNSAIDAGLRWWGGLADFFTLAVLFGLFIEYKKDFESFGSDIRGRNWKSARKEARHLIGPLLVVLGIAGEYDAQFRERSLMAQYEINLDHELERVKDALAKVIEAPSTSVLKRPNEPNGPSLRAHNRGCASKANPGCAP